MPRAPTASIAIPTRDRPDYLDVALGSIVPQAARAGAEVLVVTDGPDPASAAVAASHGARLISLPAPAGPNAARNAAVDGARGELIVFVDDDVDAPPGWLDALLTGVRNAPDLDVFGGPIVARLEGGGPRGCGREQAPITTLDLGGADRDVPMVWSANMAIRRRTFERVGSFDESFVEPGGDEEDWERRYVAGGGRIRYVANAALYHRRTAADATVRALARASYRRGRSARRQDVRKGTSRGIARELLGLAGCAWHTVRRRCAYGVVMVAHAAGRLREALRPKPYRTSDPDFLSGTSGQVYGLRRTTAAIAIDALDDAIALAQLQRVRVRRAARSSASRRVLALGVERIGEPNLLAAARAELLGSRHHVDFESTDAGARGKFENLNALLARRELESFDWLVVVDDDVALPRGFLDGFVFLAERFELGLAQPAHRARSHAAWQVTRRRAGTLARETAFVEIGPVFAFHATTFGALLPFPELRIGWGLDAHWSAIARSCGWRLGVIDATPVRHGLRRIASAYDRTAAVEEARRFLADRPYVTADEAARTLVTHRVLRS